MKLLKQPKLKLITKYDKTKKIDTGSSVVDGFTINNRPELKRVVKQTFSNDWFP